MAAPGELTHPISSPLADFSDDNMQVDSDSGSNSPVSAPTPILNHVDDQNSDIDADADVDADADADPDFVDEDVPAGNVYAAGTSGYGSKVSEREL